MHCFNLIVYIGLPPAEETLPLLNDDDDDDDDDEV